MPVGFEVAQELSAPLDLVMVQKLGAPGRPEYAIGAIVDGQDPEVVIDYQVAAAVGAEDGYIKRLIAVSLEKIRRRRAAYGLDLPLDLRDRTAVLVDDGVATGSTVKVALKAVRKAGPRSIVLAVPVAPPDTLSELAPLCDEIICLMAPKHFHAVGAHYNDLGQTSDAEVLDYLERARDFAKQVSQ